MITNPIIRGFNPDPSIIRVGEDYYLATSTFEWFPGVQIHHSRDLVHWTLIARPLNRASQLDMRGNPDGCGVWAPCLSYDGERFYLVYTDVKRYGRTTTSCSAQSASMRDFHNFIVTCDRIDGEWSDPVHINNSGFDPSLFHDADGRKWFLNQLWDHRPGRGRFAGIVLQEYCPKSERLIGERVNIFRGTELGLTEAPHLYYRNGYYYLITAEGGTGWDHAVTLARSRSITGPYELHPDKYVLSSRNHPDIPIQRAGHADLIETHAGEPYLVYLCGRPLPDVRRCPLGRETALQPMRWADDDWLYTADGSGTPSLEVPIPAEYAASENAHEVRSPQYIRNDFDSDQLQIDLQWLRTPEPRSIFSLTERPGYLRLFGRDTIGSTFTQALVARRQQAFCYTASTRMHFEPQHFQQAAGLVAYYNANKFHYCHVTVDEEIGRHLIVMTSFPEGPHDDAFSVPIPIPDGPIELRIDVDYADLRFGWRIEGSEWQWVPEIFDASILSDEASAPGQPNFTGAFVGMACQDMSGTAHPADFEWFEYQERE